MTKRESQQRPPFDERKPDDRGDVIGFTSRGWSAENLEDPRPDWAQADEDDDVSALAVAHVAATGTTSLTSL